MAVLQPGKFPAVQGVRTRHPHLLPQPLHPTPGDGSYHTWFGGNLTRDGKMVLYVNLRAGPEEDGQWIAERFALQENTTYQVHHIYDAEQEYASLTYTEQGGSAQITLEGVAHASMAAVGNKKLKFELGIPLSHVDYPEVQPPHGYVFSNMVITLEPGGPFGQAPPCP